MQGQGTDIRAWYEAAPYASFAYPQCAPEQLQAVAWLHGLRAPVPATARVLELGCSSGGNLIPVALRFPRAHALGLDISGTDIAHGQDWIRRLDLDNVELREADLLELDPASLGQFDYIVCHGLYSWVPRTAQDAMLAICRRALAPEGVVYVSYNTYPGWKSRELIRDAMLLHCSDRTDAGERLAYARAMVGFLREVAARDSVLARTVEENIKILSRTGADYLAHDYLEPDNHPCYLRDFLAHAGRHGLIYLGESEPSRSVPANYGARIAAALSTSFGDDRVRREQYLDFAVNRSFRQTLLVHEAQAARIAPAIRRERLRDLHLSAHLPCHDGATRLDGSAQTYGPRQGHNLSSPHAMVKLAADLLTARWPGTISREELRAGIQAALPPAQAVPEATLDTALDELGEYLVTRGLARIRLAPVALAGMPGAAPRLEAGAKRQIDALAEGERFVCNLWHESVELAADELAALKAGDGAVDARLAESIRSKGLLAA